jgi:ribonuclease D
VQKPSANRCFVQEQFEMKNFLDLFRKKSKSKSTSSQPLPAKSSRVSRYIDHEADLQTYLEDLHKRRVGAVALDMEGDQGTIRYAYSISIFQCFDGKETVIIDVLKMGNKPVLHRFLNDPAIIKIMFSCANDIFMAQNVLGCTITPVLDIAVGQKLLNLPIDISEHINIDKKLKETFQRANWLKRPIRDDLLEYAVNDVVDLLKIERGISTQLRKAKLADAYRKESALLTEKDYRIDQMLHYKAKFPNYKRLHTTQRKSAAAVWVFRELIGKHFDCPVGYILSKQAMAASIRNPEDTVSFLERELNRGRSSKKRVDLSLIEKYYQEALRISGGMELA